MVRWHHQLSGRGLRWTPRVGDGQGGLVCCNSWGRKESDMTDRLNSLSLRLSMETSPSVFRFFSASLNLSASIIYYGLEGVILWGSITVQSVPYSAGSGGGVELDLIDHSSHLSLGCASSYRLGNSVVPGLKPDVRQRLCFFQWLSLSYWEQGRVPSFWSRTPECQARSGCIPSSMYVPLSQHCKP